MHKHTTTHSSTESEFPDDRGLLLLVSNGEGCCRYRATQCRGFDGSASGWPGKLLRILIASEHWCECVSMRDTVERRQGEQMNCGILVWECNGIHVRQIFLSFFLVHASVYVCVPPQMFMHLCICVFQRNWVHPPVSSYLVLTVSSQQCTTQACLLHINLLDVRATMWNHCQGITEHSARNNNRKALH